MSIKIDPITTKKTATVISKNITKTSTNTVEKVSKGLLAGAAAATGVLLST